MLTLIALSAALTMQDPPSPPVPEIRTHVFVRNADGPNALDKDGDGHVSRDEFASSVNDHFARADKDGDGRLSVEELRSGHDGPGPHIMMAHGADMPGMHHFEMRRPHGNGHSANTEHRTRVMTFRGDGTPGRMEAHGPRSHHGGPGHEIEIRTMGAGQDDLDTDKDGKISEVEFTTPLRDAFGRMDKDRSGFIEAGEHGGDGDIRVFTHRLETRREGED